MTALVVIGVPSLLLLFLVIVIAAAVRSARSHDDYDLRLEKGQLTREEARALLAEEAAHNQRENDSAAFWSERWSE